MYYICKFSEAWSLYDEKKNSSRLLDKNEIDCLKNLFPALLNESGKILTAVQITGIQPNKLMKLTNTESTGKAKKPIEPTPSKQLQENSGK